MEEWIAIHMSSSWNELPANTYIVGNKTEEALSSQAHNQSAKW